MSKALAIIQLAEMLLPAPSYVKLMSLYTDSGRALGGGGGGPKCSIRPRGMFSHILRSQVIDVSYHTTG